MFGATSSKHTSTRRDATLTQAAGCALLSRYTADGVGNTLPIVPFTFRNERVERFENLLFAELRHEIFQVVLDLCSQRRSKFWIDTEVSYAPATFREFYAPWRT